MQIVNHLVTNDTPVSASSVYDLSSVDQLKDSCIGPWYLILRYWVETANVLAGTFAVNCRYTDNNGRTRTIAGTPITLADADLGFYQSPINHVYKQSNNSLWVIDTVLVGVALTAKIGWHVGVQLSDAWNDMTITP